MAGWGSCLPLWNKPQLDTLCRIRIVEPEVALLWGPLFYLSPGSAVLRPGHSSTQQGPCKSPVAAAWADLQQGCHSSILWGMSPAQKEGGAERKMWFKGNRQMNHVWTVFPLKSHWKNPFTETVSADYKPFDSFLWSWMCCNTSTSDTAAWFSIVSIFTFLSQGRCFASLLFGFEFSQQCFKKLFAFLPSCSCTCT